MANESLAPTMLQVPSKRIEKVVSRSKTMLIAGSAGKQVRTLCGMAEEMLWCKFQWQVGTAGLGATSEVDVLQLEIRHEDVSCPMRTCSLGFH